MTADSAPVAIDTVVLDVDGVIRHFDPDHRAAVERRHGLAPDTLWEAGFEPELLESLVTGQRSRQSWVDAVGVAVGSAEAAEEWLGHRGTIDWELMAVVDRLRAGRVTVAVLTNGTDTIEQELREHGVLDRFDAVFSSADIGFAKPDPRAFRHVCRSLAIDPAAVFFTDDSAGKLAGATEIGMTARRYRNPDGLLADLTELAILTDR